MLQLNRLRQRGRQPVRNHFLKIGQKCRAAVLDVMQEFDTRTKEAVYGEKSNIPLDLFLRFYFLDRKKDFLSEERAAIVQHCYAMTRWKLYLGYLCGKPITWQGRLRAYESQQFQERSKNAPPEEANMPDHVRVSFPRPLFELIRQGHGADAATKICQVSNEAACLTLRANTLKTTREELMKVFRQTEGSFDVRPTKYAPNGLRFVQPPTGNLFKMVEFKKGHFEVQDEASQLLAMRVDVKPKQTVVDYCGGSAGKSLAFAPFMHNTGQIYVHDIRKSVLLQAKQRLRRAGVQNAQVHSDKVRLRSLLKGRVDWVLLDVPCSGSGVLRRNPDMKWKFSLEKLQELLKVQELILDESLALLRDDTSKIVYTTCSILPEENIMQVTKFCDRHGFKLEDDAIFQTVPMTRGMDGFFAATLTPK